MIIGPKIFGLVLAGGKSTRMGKDKGMIPYHGMPQREFLYHLLSRVCTETFVSIRPDQKADFPEDMQTIVDDDVYKGEPLPEPLCAVWEPHALENSKSYLESGKGTCPRKFLINNETKLVIPSNANVLLNANSEEEYKEAVVRLAIE